MSASCSLCKQSSATAIETFCNVNIVRIKASVSIVELDVNVIYINVTSCTSPCSSDNLVRKLSCANNKQPLKRVFTSAHCNLQFFLYIESSTLTGTTP